jgi:cell division protease FtsH
VRPAWTGSDTRIPSTIPPVAIEAAKGQSTSKNDAGTVIAPDTGPDAAPSGASPS